MRTVRLLALRFTQLGRSMRFVCRRIPVEDISIIENVCRKCGKVQVEFEEDGVVITEQIVSISGNMFKTTNGSYQYEICETWD